MGKARQALLLLPHRVLLPPCPLRGAEGEDALPWMRAQIPLKIDLPKRSETPQVTPASPARASRSRSGTSSRSCQRQQGPAAPGSASRTDPPAQGASSPDPRGGALWWLSEKNGALLVRSSSCRCLVRRLEALPVLGVSQPSQHPSGPAVQPRSRLHLHPPFLGPDETHHRPSFSSQQAPG